MHVSFIFILFWNFILLLFYLNEWYISGKLILKRLRLLHILGWSIIWWRRDGDPSDGSLHPTSPLAILRSECLTLLRWGTRSPRTIPEDGDRSSASVYAGVCLWERMISGRRRRWSRRERRRGCRRRRWCVNTSWKTEDKSQLNTVQILSTN